MEMKSIKLLVVTLMLALAGFVYAEGQSQDSKMACGTDKAGCCATMDCCKKDGAECCKAHKMGNQQQTASQDKGKACCDGGECCKDGKSCCGEGCKMDKTGKAAGCCETGKDGGCCKAAKDKAKTS
jgi:hypothetical protein